MTPSKQIQNSNPLGDPSPSPISASLTNSVTQIKKDVPIKRLRTRKTNKSVRGIVKEVHREWINNATNSVSLVAVLIATVAFAAIFTVPGGNNEDGSAVVVDQASFKIFFISDAIALFTSLAVVVLQITLVRWKLKAERKVVEAMNKLMWWASIFTSVAFMASTYIVVGRKSEWAAVFITLLGGLIMGLVFGAVTYYEVKAKKIQSMRRRRKIPTSGTARVSISDSEIESI